MVTSAAVCSDSDVGPLCAGWMMTTCFELCRPAITFRELRFICHHGEGLEASFPTRGTYACSVSWFWVALIFALAYGVAMTLEQWFQGCGSWFSVLGGSGALVSGTSTFRELRLICHHGEGLEASFPTRGTYACSVSWFWVALIFALAYGVAMTWEQWFQGRGSWFSVLGGSGALVSGTPSLPTSMVCAFITLVGTNGVNSLPCPNLPRVRHWCGQPAGILHGLKAFVSPIGLQYPGLWSVQDVLAEGMAMVLGYGHPIEIPGDKGASSSTRAFDTWAARVIWDDLTEGCMDVVQSPQLHCTDPAAKGLFHVGLRLTVESLVVVFLFMLVADSHLQYSGSQDLGYTSW